MAATLSVTHKSIGVEVRRAPYDVLPIFLASFFVPSLALTLVPTGRRSAPMGSAEDSQAAR